MSSRSSGAVVTHLACERPGDALGVTAVRSLVQLSGAEGAELRAHADADEHEPVDQNVVSDREHVHGETVEVVTVTRLGISLAA